MRRDFVESGKFSNGVHVVDHSRLMKRKLTTCHKQQGEWVVWVLGVVISCTKCPSHQDWEQVECGNDYVLHFVLGFPREGHIGKRRPFPLVAVLRGHGLLVACVRGCKSRRLEVEKRGHSKKKGGLRWLGNSVNLSVELVNWIVFSDRLYRIHDLIQNNFRTSIPNSTNCPTMQCKGALFIANLTKGTSRLPGRL